jgi:hypothetical protein
VKSSPPISAVIWATTPSCVPVTTRYAFSNSEPRHHDRTNGSHFHHNRTPRQARPCKATTSLPTEI